ncbi:MAG: hypothetical protein JSV17_09510 [Candidatus Aminicenantes bacterium]|nr:MAG: hypothetical protein JSV17_09510 [Candidatus Aminicenantes bacterium]
MGKRRNRMDVFRLCLLFGLSCFFTGAGELVKPSPVDQTGLEISVMSQVDWTDTGLDVVEGQEIIFRAVGQISLQKGNPVTYCDPDGYNYQSLQQPLQDQNIGALIGKVYFLISLEIDEETGEEIRNEREELFYIGSARRITIPMDGRLYLGINETLVADNDGVFHVLIYTFVP